MKTFVFVFVLFVALVTFLSYQNHNRTPRVPQEIKLLTQAEQLFEVKRYAEAASVDLQVIEMTGVPNSVRAVAFLIMGNIGIATGDLDIASASYNEVLKLHDIPESAYTTATSGLDLIERIKQAAQNNKEDNELRPAPTLKYPTIQTI